MRIRDRDVTGIEVYTHSDCFSQNMLLSIGKRIVTIRSAERYLGQYELLSYFYNSYIYASNWS